MGKGGIKKGEVRNPKGYSGWQKGMASPNPSGSHKDKLFGNAIRLALLREFDDEGETKTYLSKVVEVLLGLATDGSLSAIQEIINRIDGRAVNVTESAITTHVGETEEETDEERQANDAMWFAKRIVEIAAEKTERQKRKMN